jgi:hypothetical protein
VVPVAALIKQGMAEEAVTVVFTEVELEEVDVARLALLLEKVERELMGLLL